MSSNVITEDIGEFLVEEALSTGVSAASVKDGHILLFTREKLQETLEANLDSKIITIFIKRPDMH